MVNRPLRIRMQGGVGRAGEKPALTQLAIDMILNFLHRHFVAKVYQLLLQ